MTLNKTHAIALSLFAISLLLRIFLVSKGPYNVDCLNLTIQAEKLLAEGRLTYIVGFGYPLTIILASLFIFTVQLFQLSDHVLAVNYMSVVFGALSVPVFYYIVKKFADQKASVIGSILLSLCPIVLGNSLFGMSHAPALFFQLCAILLIIKFLECQKARYLILGAFCFGCFGAARFQDMVLIIPAVCYLIAFYHHPQKTSSFSAKTKLTNLIIFLSTAAVVVLLFHAPYLLEKNRHEYVQQIGMFQRVSLSSIDFTFTKYALRQNMMYLIQTLSLAGFIVSLAGFAFIYKDNRRFFWFLIVWIAAPLALFSHLFTVSPRHQILMIPAFIILECYTLRKLLLFNKFFRVSSMSIMIFIILLSSAHYYPLFAFRHRHAVVTEYARWLGRATEENARIISTDFSLFITRYAKREPIGRILIDRHLYTQEELDNYKLELEGLLEQGIPVYITESGLLAYDFGKKFSDYMISNFELKYVGEHLYEDWHRGYLHPAIFKNSLFKIGRKK